MRQERHQNAAKHENGDAHSLIYTLIYVHIALYGHHISLCKRLIQAIDDGGIKAKVRKGQQGKHIGEQARYAKVLFPQQRDKHPAGKEAHQDAEHLTSYAERHIFQRI